MDTDHKAWDEMARGVREARAHLRRSRELLVKVQRRPLMQRVLRP